MKTVHPRLRGELFRDVENELTLNGSSPLTRGTQGTEELADVLLRFIPAYAGNSQNKSSANLVDAVHPRLRGELFGACICFLFLFGSSPLTRGTRNILSVATQVQSVHPRLRGELNCGSF